MQNALYTCELAGADVPVYAGAAEPRARELAHGPGSARRRRHGRHRPAAARPRARRRRRRAGARRRDPRAARRGDARHARPAHERRRARSSSHRRSRRSSARSSSWAGRRITVGNVTPLAEYNIWADPEAAAIVFASGAPMTMVGWDISRKYAVITPAGRGRVARARPARRLQRRHPAHADRVLPRADAARRLRPPRPDRDGDRDRPGIATDVRALHVAVETQGELTRGATVVDFRGTAQAPNADVVLEASRDRFLARCAMRSAASARSAARRSARSDRIAPSASSRG